MELQSKLSRLFLDSPWLILVFFAVPAAVILSVSLHIRLPLSGYKPLLFNNAVLALLMAIRFLYRLSKAKKPLRYSPLQGRPQQGESISGSIDDVRNRLVLDGFTLNASRTYGEKREIGFFGTALIYAGMGMLLLTGIWDSLGQFSGTLLDGVGLPTKLNNVEIYRVLKKGPLTPEPKDLPQLQVIRQFLPDNTYPDGATGILLLSEDGNGAKKILKPGERFTYRGYEIEMSRLLFEPVILVKTRDTNKIVFNGPVRLNPLVQKVGDYGFSGDVCVDKMVATVYYQPEQSNLRVIIKNRDKLILNTGMRFQVDPQVVQGGLVLSCEKLGQWSEIQVVRKRHTALMMLWAIVAALGSLLRITFRAKRVWLEETPDGPMVWKRG